MLLTIDYRNKFPTLWHNCIRAALTLLSFPPTFVSLVTSLVHSQYHFLVGRAAMRELTFYEEAGIGQGDLFSPQLLWFCASILEGQPQTTPQDAPVRPNQPPPPQTRDQHVQPHHHRHL